MPASPYPLDAMMDELMALVREEFRHKPWRRLVDGVFKNEALREAFRTCPAAKGVHHAYAGGLLEHTLGVFKLCRRLADQYPELDRQTLLAGALFHDFRQDPRIFRRHRQRLYRRGPPAGAPGDLRGDAGPLSEKSGLEPELQRHLKHLVLSHHGTLEFGAVRVPQTAEALALHYADNIDAKMAQCRGLFAQLGEGESWTPYQATLGRAMHRCARTPVEEKVEKKSRASRKNPGDDGMLSLL